MKPWRGCSWITNLAFIGISARCSRALQASTPFGFTTRSSKALIMTLREHSSVSGYQSCRRFRSPEFTPLGCWLSLLRTTPNRLLITRLPHDKPETKFGVCAKVRATAAKPMRFNGATVLGAGAGESPRCRAASSAWI